MAREYHAQKRYLTPAERRRIVAKLEAAGTALRAFIGASPPGSTARTRRVAGLRVEEAGAILDANLRAARLGFLYRESLDESGRVVRRLLNKR